MQSLALGKEDALVMISWGWPGLGACWEDLGGLAREQDECEPVWAGSWEGQWQQIRRWKGVIICPYSALTEPHLEHCVQILVFLYKRDLNWCVWVQQRASKLVREQEHQPCEEGLRELSFELCLLVCGRGLWGRQSQSQLCLNWTLAVCHGLSPAGNYTSHSYSLTSPPVGWQEESQNGKIEKARGLK